MREQHPKEILVAQLVAIGMLLYALAPWNPYGYYVLLRLVLCGVAIYLAVQAYRQMSLGWAWTFGIAAATYNPFIQVHLTRQIWSFVNLATIALIAVSISALRKMDGGEDK